ncbi:MAG: hypothetical protein H6722_10660 [Sandaracinus sp.]|nr:hypothetical protein [Myxococcales bacterium]MCB9612901.1 hypothetical protein [Sandaracinus sp.]
MTSPLEMRLRVLALLAEPMLEIARASALRLDDLRELVATEYFELLRRRGASWTQIAQRLGKSRRTIAELARRSADQESLREPSERLEVRRRIVRALAEGASTPEALSRRVGSPFLADELEALREAGIVAGDATRPELAAELLDLVGPDLEARLASLQQFLETVADVIYARFVRPRPDRLAFARVWSFSAAPEALAQVIDEVYALIDQRVAELDAAAPEGARPANVSFVAVEPPDDERWRRRRG